MQAYRGKTMTREEAIKQLKKLKSFHNGSYGEALNFAIESIKVDMAYDLAYERVESDCDDCIGRQAVKELFQEACEMEMYDFLGIDDLPSVTPQESVLDKMRTEIEKQDKWLAQAGYNAYNVDIAFNSIKHVIAESEE